MKLARTRARRVQRRSMDQNLIDFEEQFVPLLKAAKERGLS